MKGKHFLSLSIIGILAVTALSLGLYFAFRAPTVRGLTVTDDLGRAVNIKGIPQKIVSLSPGTTEILFALDEGDKIVGVTNQCDYPEEAKTKPKIGDYWEPNIEQIVALGPDLVLTEAYKAGLVAQLEQVGLTVVVLEPRDIHGILCDILLMGQATGAGERAQRVVANAEQRIQVVTAKAEKASKLGVLYEGDSSYGIWTAGPGTFVDELITLAGGRNVGAIKEGYYEISDEVLLWANDAIDVIVWADMGGVSPDDMRGKLPWSGLAAMQAGKVYAIDPDLVNRPGPRIIDGLEKLASIIHPELF
jgi:iron complex transport system substrate-binding protein